VCTCPGWSSEEILCRLLRYTGLSSLWLVPMESRKHGLLTISWKKLTIKAPSRNPIRTTTYKMLEEVVRS
jgi:hypothetical protein